jgi:hypothetical protein
MCPGWKWLVNWDGRVLGCAADNTSEGVTLISAGALGSFPRVRQSIFFLPAEDTIYNCLGSQLIPVDVNGFLDSSRHVHEMLDSTECSNINGGRG